MKKKVAKIKKNLYKKTQSTVDTTKALMKKMNSFAHPLACLYIINSMMILALGYHLVLVQSFYADLESVAVSIEESQSGDEGTVLGARTQRDSNESEDDDDDENDEDDDEDDNDEEVIDENNSQPEVVVVERVVEIPVRDNSNNNNNQSVVRENNASPVVRNENEKPKKVVDFSKVSDRNKVIAYDFDESGDTNDSSGYENHAENKNGVRVTNTDGARFDGERQYLSVENSDELNFEQNNFSISFWLQKDVSDEEDRGIYYKKSQVNDSSIVIMTYLKGQYVYFGIKDENGNAAATFSSQSINDGNWHHIAAIRDGDQVKVYVDGILSGAGDASLVGSVSNESDLQIGFSKERGLFKGKIDNVQVFTEAMSEGDVARFSSSR